MFSFLLVQSQIYPCSIAKILLIWYHTKKLIKKILQDWQLLGHDGWPLIVICSDLSLGHACVQEACLQLAPSQRIHSVIKTLFQKHKDRQDENFLKLRYLIQWGCLYQEGQRTAPRFCSYCTYGVGVSSFWNFSKCNSCSCCFTNIVCDYSHLQFKKRQHKKTWEIHWGCFVNN